MSGVPSPLVSVAAFSLTVYWPGAKPENVKLPLASVVVVVSR